METDFKYCSSLYTAIGRFGIYFADPVKKSFSKELKKIIDKEGGKETVVSNSKFEIKLDHSNFYIKHPDLSDKFYKLGNIVEDNSLIYDIISQSTINNGIFDGNNWSIIINSEKKCLFAKDGMKIYEDSWNETMRKFNCETMKHTTNLIPGHRYDNVDGTYYYFGEFLDTSSTASGQVGYDDNGNNVYFAFLYTKEDFSSNDLAKIYVENYNKIKFVSKKPKSLVDSGEFAKDTLISSDAYSLFKNYINSLNKEDLNVLRILYFLHYKKVGKYTKDKDIIDLLSGLLKTEMNRILNQIFGNSSTADSREVSNKLKLKDNVENLIFTFFERTSYDTRYYSSTNYYISLLNYLDVDINSIAEDCISSFNVPDKTIDNIFSNTEYFENHKYEFLGKTITIDQSGYLYADSIKFTDEIRKFIIDILPKVKDNSYSWEEYHKMNMGTISNPLYQETYCITLNTYKNIFGEKLTTEAENAIVNYGFFNVHIIKNV